MKDRFVTEKEFAVLLKKARLGKKELAQILQIATQIVYGWGNSGQGYPYWVKS